MKRIQKLLLAFCLMLPVIFLPSCNEKANFSDINIKILDDAENGEDGIILKDGKPFTGEVWSQDNATICIKIEDGVAKEMSFYHMNGKIAVYQIPYKQYIYYDDEGNVISRDSFMDKYGYLSDKIQSIFNSEIKVITNH